MNDRNGSVDRRFSRRVGPWTACVAALLALIAVPAAAQDSRMPSSFFGQVQGPSVTALDSPVPCVGGESTALIQDVVPWADPFGSPLGGNVDELLASGTPFCILMSTDVAFADLTPFGVIIISSGQTQDFYDTVFPFGAIDNNIFTWVDGGGVLLGHLADCASGPGNGGVWSSQPCPVTADASYAFEGGLVHQANFSDDNNIGQPLHPIITGTINGVPLPCPSGNCGQIVDTDQFTDLDGWGLSSHGFFTQLIPLTNVILTDPTPPEGPEPVMVEYNSACGRVIATMTTIEYRYVGGFGTVPQNKKLLANEFAYAQFLASSGLCSSPQ